LKTFLAVALLAGYFSPIFQTPLWPGVLFALRCIFFRITLSAVTYLRYYLSFGVWQRLVSQLSKLGPWNFLVSAGSIYRVSEVIFSFPTGILFFALFLALGSILFLFVLRCFCIRKKPLWRLSLGWFLFGCDFLNVPVGIANVFGRRLIWPEAVREWL